LGSRVPLHVVGAVAFASLISGLKGLTLSPGLWKKGKPPAGEFPLGFWLMGDV